VTEQELQWIEGYRRTIERFGSFDNIPQLVEHYQSPTLGGGFAVIDAVVHLVQPVFDTMGDPVTFTEALREELRDDHFFAVCDRWGIPAT
jgi:hypothetical protein